MPNPQGTNGLFSPEPAYGDVGTQKRLAGQAPMSGAPLATAATQAPRRAQRQASSRRKGAPPPPEAPVVTQLPAPTYPAAFSALAAKLAADPGAGPNLQWLAQAATQAPAGAPFQGH